MGDIMSRHYNYLNDVFTCCFDYSCMLCQKENPKVIIPPLGITDNERKNIIDKIIECIEKYPWRIDSAAIKETAQKYPESCDEEIKQIIALRKILINIFYNAINISIIEETCFITLHEIVNGLNCLSLLGINIEDIQLISEQLVGYKIEGLIVPCDPAYNHAAYNIYQYVADCLKEIYRERKSTNITVPFYLITNEEMQTIYDFIENFVLEHQEANYGISEEIVTNRLRECPNISYEQCLFNLQRDTLLQEIFANAINYAIESNFKCVTIHEIIMVGLYALKQNNIPNNVIAELKGHMAIKFKTNSEDVLVITGEDLENLNISSQMREYLNLVIDNTKFTDTFAIKKNNRIS